MIWVLIDASFLAHRARYTMRGLEFDHAPTGVLFGFFESLRSICFDPRIASNRVAVFFDSTASHRRNAFPAYKAKRHENRTPAEVHDIQVMHRQMEILQRNVLPAVGFPCFKQIGLESDDLIASAAQSLTVADVFGDAGAKKAGVIVSADGDLYQCISWNVHWFDPVRDLYLDPLGFLHHKGIDHSLWCKVKCLAGCHGDNVPGIPGIGEKSAIDYLTNLLPRTHARHKRIESPEGRAVARRNKELVRLPHKRTRPVELTDPKYDAVAFRKFVADYGLSTYMDRHAKQWENFFAGNMSVNRQTARRRGETREEN